MSKLYDLVNKSGGLDELATDLLNGSHFLLNELEHAFDPARGEKFGTTGRRLVFQETTLDANMWLLGRIWSQIRDLHDVVAEVRVLLDEHHEAIEAALPKEAGDV